MSQILYTSESVATSVFTQGHTRNLKKRRHTSTCPWAVSTSRRPLPLPDTPEWPLSLFSPFGPGLSRRDLKEG